VKRSFPVIWDATRATPSPSDCFADEIAIDFPSAGQFVERARGAFPDEAGGDVTLTTDVWLSRRDRSFGVIVPLDVPLRGTCGRCGGRGETWTEPCADCRGTGDSVVPHPVQLSVPPGVDDGARFRFRVRSTHAAPLRVEVRIRFADTR
jgi:hypothetical protein